MYFLEVLFLYMSFFGHVYSFSYIPNNKTAGSWGRCIFNITRSCQTHLQNGYTIIHPHRQYMSVLVAPHTCQRLVILVLSTLAFLMDMQQYQIVDLIYMTKAVEHLFIYLMAIQISFVKYLLKSFAYFLNWVICIFNQLAEVIYIFCVTYMCYKYFLVCAFPFFMYLRTVWGDTSSQVSHVSSFIVSKLLPELFSGLSLMGVCTASSFGRKR